MDKMKISKEAACHIAKQIFDDLLGLDEGIQLFPCAKNDGLFSKKDTDCRACSWQACYYALLLEMINKGCFFHVKVENETTNPEHKP